MNITDFLDHLHKTRGWQLDADYYSHIAVSYTPLTLPTTYPVEIPVGAVSIKKKIGGYTS